MRKLKLTGLLVAALAGLSCRDRSTQNGTRPDAGPVSAPSATVSASASAPKASASTPVIVPRAPVFLEDAGVATTCRLVQGPLQQTMTGPVALVASARGLEVISHRAGIAIVNVVPVTAVPPPTAKPQKQTFGDVAPDKASKPPCAAAGRFSFCSDAKGMVHKSRREMASDEQLTQALPGARLTAASLGDDHVVVGTIQSVRMPEGERLEAWAKLDGEPPVRISEEGAGASDVAFAVRKPGEVVAFMVDARTAMTPVHMRVLKLVDKKLDVGHDVVVHVASGSSRIVQGVLGTTDKGTVVGLLAAGAESGFGLVSVPLPHGIKEDAPFSFSPYPNGLDGAPLSATQGGAHIYVARVRPSLAPGQSPAVSDGGAALPPWVLELGRLEEKGAFHSLGLVPSTGSVLHAAIAVDSFGAIWVHYTDASGSWLERRVC